jgi:KDO2-lipid IV(A) lauroyltransferase
VKRIFWAIQAAIFYLLTLLASMIPVSASYRLGALAGLFISSILPGRRAIVIDNINRALPFMRTHRLWDPLHPDAEELTRETFRNMGRSLIEISRLYQGRDRGMIAGIELRGLENLEKARAKGKGVICFSGHCGNWELMALAFGGLFGGGVVVARRQNNPFFDQMVTRMRMRYQSRVLYKKGALRGILKALKKGDLVGVLADQAVKPEKGVLVDIMGRKAWASKAPVMIARSSGAPLVPVFIHREGERQVISFYPEYTFSEDVSEEGMRKDVQALSRYVEDFVVAHPAQWYWVHRRWKRAGEIVAPSTAVGAAPGCSESASFQSGRQDPR